MLETRRQRRQRKLEGVEIPESFVTVTDECLGTGGFGSVYIADYNGHNAAAKVCNSILVVSRRSQLDIGILATPLNVHFHRM